MNKTMFLLLLLCVVSSSATYYSQICPASRVVELVRNESSGFFEYQDANVIDDQNDSSNTTTRFRECSCPRPIYHAEFVCPVDARICGIPVDLHEPVLCFKDDASIMVVRNVRKRVRDDLLVSFASTHSMFYDFMRRCRFGLWSVCGIYVSSFFYVVPLKGAMPLRIAFRGASQQPTIYW